MSFADNYGCRLCCLLRGLPHRASRSYQAIGDLSASCANPYISSIDSMTIAAGCSVAIRLYAKAAAKSLSDMIPDVKAASSLRCGTNRYLQEP